jgi:hypothetical protein
VLHIVSIVTSSNPSSSNSQFVHDVFKKSGFKNWKKASENFKPHVGGPMSIHNNARSSCEDFMNENKVWHMLSLLTRRNHILIMKFV